MKKKMSYIQPELKQLQASTNMQCTTGTTANTNPSVCAPGGSIFYVTCITGTIASGQGIVGSGGGESQCNTLGSDNIDGGCQANGDAPSNPSNCISTGGSANCSSGNSDTTP